jgi:regulator of protease activity HflC (stomatin/prohibitin superfamily)
MVVVLVVVGLLLLAAAIWAVLNASSQESVGSLGLAVVLALMSLASCGTAFSAIEVIPAQNVAVVHHTTKSEGNNLEKVGSGVKVFAPFTDRVTQYTLAQQDVTLAGAADGGEDRIVAISNDGQQIFIDVTVIYSIRPDKVLDLHLQWQDRYAVGYIVPNARSVVRDIVSNYSAQQIYEGGRDELEADAQSLLITKIEETGLFIVSDVLFRDITFSPEYMAAVEQKQIAEQEAQQQENKVRQSQAEAEQARVNAQGKADAAVIAAKGEAEATILQAQAKAEALRLVAELLAENPDLLEYEYIQKLADDVTIIVLPSDSPYIFDPTGLMPPTESGAQPH